MTVALAVIAKAPVAGRVKTRLCPPCTPEQAAELARAALEDTLAAVAATPADRRVCVLDGEPGDWLPSGFEVIPQRGGGLDERLGAAFADIAVPTFLVGMDTPQVEPALLARCADALRTGAVAQLGRTFDGGYWGIGLAGGGPEHFEGVPMSTDRTGAEQLERLRSLGLEVDPDLPVLEDVDDIAAARRVAEIAPGSRFARRLRDLRVADAEPTAS